ncbi:meiotically up-regulated gene 56 protein [Glonium stellatum]|uniref:Meiotically up-regulated gene 56 protein n=1 Tax=Glonium stellatum TaxID=574774 RepID=A0A8E2ETX7_9PEZI|nr:meiotically up-regulated gene 56 protein [Glonium stellatum]
MTESTTRRRSWHEQPHLLHLPSTSYTAQRLQHATSEHLFLTSRREFIGPIPEGWLKSHRRDWYKHHLHINYSSRAATFSASAKQSRQRRLTGLEGPSTSAIYGHSFPQPDDLSVEDEDGEVGAAESSESAVVTTETSPGMSIPRGSDANDEAVVGKASLEYIDALSEPDEDITPMDRSTPSPEASKKTASAKTRRKSSTHSYVTASDGSSRHHSLDQTTRDGADGKPSGLQVTEPLGEEGRGSPGKWSGSITETSNLAMASSGASDPLRETASTSPLLRKADMGKKGSGGDQSMTGPTKGIISRVTGRLQNSSADSTDLANTAQEDSGFTVTRTRSTLRGLVHFDIPEDSRLAELQLKAKAAQLTIQRASTHVRRKKVKDGQVIKMERMLVRVDAAKDVPDDYDENNDQKIDSRTADKWREYMVVCRQSFSENADMVLQMYKTRVIPAIEKAHTNKSAKHEIMLGRKTAKINLYSSLDKSVVVWTPSSRGARIYIMQARTGSHAVEWYTFIRNVLGWRRASELQINIPDLSVSLRIENPFEKLEQSQIAAQETEDGEEEAVLRTMKEEEAVASNLVKRCLSMLDTSKEWSDILDAWCQGEPIGLAWKRYDRLEWIHGANERKMYGTIAMMKSHELELRPKSHYPTTVVTRKKKKTLIEPVPVEGFLIRLTSQRGVDRKLGRLFFKRLYFSTHDHYLVFSRPANATPPPPPKLPASTNSRVPAAHQIADNIPLIYAVNPYPVKDGEIEWLSAEHSGTTESRRLHDQDAHDEAERKADILLKCDGYINLCDVNKVRKVRRGETLADENIESGSDVDFDAEVEDTARDDGATNEFNDDRTFELVLQNRLIIRLQAYDKETKKEWIKRLQQLVKYWKLRTMADINLYKSVRRQNLEKLNIDEETEAYVGQFARKWEVTQSYASPELYNLCGISCCRTIHMSGTLYHVLRSRTGKGLAQIHHERTASINLKDCYIYSGLLTENDLLYQNQTFDSNKPGHHALPKMYLEDGWTSTDEDVMTTFVVWHGQKKGWFRSESEGGARGEIGVNEGKRTKIKRVGKLGTTGRSVVFRARSRAERDHWVLAIQSEIERRMDDEDFRITEKEAVGGESREIE